MFWITGGAVLVLLVYSLRRPPRWMFRRRETMHPYFVTWPPERTGHTLGKWRKTPPHRTAPQRISDTFVHFGTLFILKTVAPILALFIGTDDEAPKVQIPRRIKKSVRR